MYKSPFQILDPYEWFCGPGSHMKEIGCMQPCIYKEVSSAGIQMHGNTTQSQNNWDWRSNTEAPAQKHSLVPQHLPGRFDVRVQVLLGRFPGTDPVTRVVIGEHVAVDPGAEADVEAAHLAQIHGVPVGEQQRVAASGRAADEHAADPVPAAGAGHQHLDGIQLALRVLPVGALSEMQARRAARVCVDGVGGLWRQERQLSRDATRTRRAAEEPAQLAE